MQILQILFGSKNRPEAIRTIVNFGNWKQTLSLGEIFMRRALFVAVYVVGSGCALAIAASTTPAVVVADRTAYGMSHQKLEAVKVSVVNSEKQAGSIAPSAASGNSKSGNSGVRTYDALLATLVLMGAIALRRYWSVKR